ncbi:MAG: hypothetical protein WAX89_00285, partial [Alphaproteobacteria bacterium]
CVRARDLAAYSILVAKLGLVAGLVAVACVPFGHKPLVFAWAFGAGMVVAAGVMHLWQRQYLRSIPAGKNVPLTAAEWDVVRRFMPVAIMANIINVAAVQLDVMLVDYWITDTVAIGLYMFALVFANGLLLFQGPLVAYLLPEFGPLLRNEPARFNWHVWRYQVLLTGGLAALAAGIAVVLPWLSGLVYPVAYAPAMVYLPWVLAIAVAQSGYGVLLVGLFVRDRLLASTLCTLLSTGFTLAVAWVLVPTYGLWGIVGAKLAGNMLFIGLAAAALHWPEKVQPKQ